MKSLPNVIAIAVVGIISGFLYGKVSELHPQTAFLMGMGWAFCCSLFGFLSHTVNLLLSNHLATKDIE